MNDYIEAAEVVEMLRKNGYRARIDNGVVKVQCSKGLVAVRVSADDPAVMAAVNSILPANSPRFSREGEMGFTAFFRGKLKSREMVLVGGQKVEILANGEWVTVPGKPKIQPSPSTHP